MKNVTCLMLLCIWSLFLPRAGAAANETITAGWYHWAPYQYVEENGNLTGLDVALVTAIFNSQSMQVEYDPDSPGTWAQNQKDALEGSKDIAAGAFESDYRRKAYHVSKPYRYEWNTLYVRTVNLPEFDVYLIGDLIELIEDKKFRLGVIAGYNYTSPELNRFIAEQVEQESGLIVAAATEEENFDNIASGEADIVVSDRLVGARIIWQNQLGAVISEHPLQLPAKPIHLLIHRSDDPEKDARSQKILQAFNRGVEQLTLNGQINNIIGNYLFPVLMNITVQRDWFYSVDIIGAIFFAMAGFFMAREKNYDIFGTLVMTGLLVAGGGLMRDLIVGRYPAILRTSDYVFIIVLMCVIGFLLNFIHQYLVHKWISYREGTARHSRYFHLTRELIEAIALGAYTIVGVGVAVEMKLDPLWLWGPLLGCLTSCGGGLIANTLKGDEIKNMSGGVEPECALFWGSFFSMFMIWQTDRLNPDEVFIGVIITLIGCTLMLMTLSRYRLTSPRMSTEVPETESTEPEMEPAEKIGKVT